MTKETREYVEKQAKALLEVPFACKEAKDVCQKWLKAEGSKDEKKASIALIKELKEDVESIDDLLGFAHSPDCVRAFGEKQAKGFLAHAEELKAKGAKYCDCPACSAAVNIINKEKEIIA